MKPKTTLHPSLYRLIYNALKNEFIRNEWPIANGLPGEDFAIWEKEGDNGLTQVTNLFGVNYKYFYERYKRAENDEAINIYNDTLRNVLEYLKCVGDKISELTDDFYVSYKVPAEVIQLQSKQKHIRSSAKKNSKKHEENYAVTTTNHHLSADTIHHKTVNNINIYSNAPDTSDDVSRVVYLFYEHISKGNHSSYESAWALLSEGFKDRIWEKMAREAGLGKTGIDLFKDGYYFFRSLKKTHVFNVEIDFATADCMVYYEENLELPHIGELADIGKTSIKNAKSIIDKIESVAKAVEEFGGKGFGNKALMRLFYPTPTETIWFEHGMNHAAFKEAYPNTTHASISRLLKCRCIRDNDTWLIDGLVPFHCRQL